MFGRGSPTKRIVMFCKKIKIIQKKKVFSTRILADRANDETKWHLRPAIILSWRPVSRRRTKCSIFTCIVLRPYYSFILFCVSRFIFTWRRHVHDERSSFWRFFFFSQTHHINNTRWRFASRSVSRWCLFAVRFVYNQCHRIRRCSDPVGK